MNVSQRELDIIKVLLASPTRSYTANQIEGRAGRYGPKTAHRRAQRLVDAGILQCNGKLYELCPWVQSTSQFYVECEHRGRRRIPDSIRRKIIADRLTSYMAAKTLDVSERTARHIINEARRDEERFYGPSRKPKVIETREQTIAREARELAEWSA